MLWGFKKKKKKALRNLNISSRRGIFGREGVLGPAAWVWSQTPRAVTRLGRQGLHA